VRIELLVRLHRHAIGLKGPRSSRTRASLYITPVRDEAPRSGRYILDREAAVAHEDGVESSSALTVRRRRRPARGRCAESAGGEDLAEGSARKRNEAFSPSDSKPEVASFDHRRGAGDDGNHARDEDAHSRPGRCAVGTPSARCTPVDQPDAAALSPEHLDAIERVAVELAAAAGAEISSALIRTLSVRYKTAASGNEPPRDPVSDVDRSVEEMLRAEVRARFPGHAVLGEEFETDEPEDAELVWAVDPIDGTTNFLHAFPLFATSIGVLHHGRPVVGAVWCSASHELKPGVFHARLGGGLRFENQALRRREANTAIVGRLFGDPGRIEARSDQQGRTTGSAAIECAFVAAGILDWAVFQGPRVWDVAGGLALVIASGRKVWSRAPEWGAFESFLGPGDLPRGVAALRRWQAQIRLGADSAGSDPPWR
jgi:myo-inositol-1(or 4)-monophosphatase